MRKVRKVLDIFGRFLFVLCVLALTFVFAMFQGGKVSWTIFYSLLPFVMYSTLLFFYPLTEIKVKRSIQTVSNRNGGKFLVTLLVKRKSRFPLLYTVVSEKWADDKRDSMVDVRLKKLFIFGFRKEKEWQYEIEQLPRGEHVLQGVVVEVSDFFGWLRKTKFIDAKDTILVFPKMMDLDYVPFDTQYDRGTQASLLNIVKDTTMATGVRGYQPGDRVTWIHWKSFARTQTLMTKEFEDRRSQELFLILDGRVTGTFEEQVELTASIMKEASSHQAGLALMTTGSESSLFPMIQSEEQQHQALVHLAKIKPTEKDKTATSSDFGTGFQHGGSIVLVTGKPDWSFMKSLLRGTKNARSIICFVVIKGDEPTPSAIEEDIRLARSKGVIVHVLGKEQFREAFKEVAGR
ncbi:DUF58 domain-containing protein [Sporosarcina sp. NPDC096371]|uniref:DUF58 domain-containing protein n=1 Tax=Sporosarcina sp. NPDC096371 TaxID=3364530 RepID=UPI0038243F02